jgi:hypothetical protein
MLEDVDRLPSAAAAATHQTSYGAKILHGVSPRRTTVMSGHSQDRSRPRTEDTVRMQRNGTVGVSWDVLPTINRLRVMRPHE